MFAFASSASVYAQPQHPGLSFYSTYPSEALSAQCHTLEVAPSSPLSCTEDFISPDYYVEALNKVGNFAQIAPFTGGNDYELLVANLSRDTNDITHFSEFTLQWRGIEIDSFSTSGHEQTSEAVAIAAVTNWMTHAASSAIFSAPYLYGSIGASDYLSALKLPQTIDQFERTNTQLYLDPFQGAITRYVHNEFDDAIVDVSVFPYMAQTQMPSNSLLIGELESDQQLAESVAERQNLQFVSTQAISPFVTLNGTNGFKLHLVANSVNEEPIYATSYAFFAKDKVVKVSTTFPEVLSDEFANVLIANIEVPDESKLMSQIRLLLLEADRN